MVVARRLLAIRARYPELDELASDFEGNYQNANREVVNALLRMDSEIRQPFIEKTYGSGRSLEELADVDYLDVGITDYGDMLVLIRFCDGYMGNLAQGQRLTKNQCVALMFGYECYWREGEDFLLGIVVENHLRRIPSPEEWKWPDDAAFEGREENRQLQWLGYTIAKEMKALARHHRLNQPGFDNFRSSENAKPALRDFRAVLEQIEGAAAAEREAAQTSSGPAEDSQHRTAEEEESARGALEAYIAELDASRQIAVRKLLKDDAFARDALLMVELASRAMAATVLPADEFKKFADPLRPSVKRHPEIRAIARHYIVDNGDEVFRAMSWQFAFDTNAVTRAERNFAELRKLLRGH